MKKMTLSDVKAYDAPGHFGVSTMRLHGQEETGASKFWMGLSHFLPGGGCDLGVPPGEKVYFVLEGEITIKNKTEEHILGKNELIFIAPGEEREILNHTNQPVSMLVIYNYE